MGGIADYSGSLVLQMPIAERDMKNSLTSFMDHSTVTLGQPGGMMSLL
jgi:hypothetical protein